MTADEILKKRRDDSNIELQRHMEEVREKILGYSEVEKEIFDNSKAFSLAAIHKDEGKKAELFRKIDVLKRQKEKMLIDAGYPEDYLVRKHICPMCEDTGFVEYKFVDGTTYSFRCKCLEELILYEKNNAAGFPINMNAKGLDDYSLDCFDDIELIHFTSYSEPLTQREYYKDCILPQARKYLNNVLSGSRQNSLLLTGTAGSGKTHLSVCIAKDLIKKGKRVRYTSMSSLYDTVRRLNYANEWADKSNETIDEYKKCEFLIIDDLGSEGNSSMIPSVIFDIINTRMGAFLPTVISSNITLDDIGQVYGDRVASRLISRDQWMNLRMIGRDVRLNRANGS